MHFDIAVLGAGPAGAAAARQARALGLSVALIDRATFPRDKLCGALVSGRARRAIEAVFGRLPDPSLFLVSREVAFHWDGEELCRFTAPYDLTYTYRRKLDHWLLDEALAAGAEDFTGCRAERIDEAAGRLVLADGRELGFGVLIGADGAASPVARHLFGQAIDPQTIGFAYETELPVPQPEGALMTIDFAIVRWGYGWTFPKRDSLTVGLGALKAVDQDLAALMARYVAAAGGDGDARIKGAFIPLGDYRAQPGRGNVLLAGDAAGMVDSMTGEGIAYALESGARAAEAAQEALAAGKAGRAMERYLPKVRYIHAELDKSNRLRQIAFAGPLRALFRQKLATSENMRRAFFEMLEGNLTYADVEKKVARATLGRLGRGMTGWPAAFARRRG